MVVLINVFTVEPTNQQRLVDLLTRATDGSVNRAPGFISATLHRSVDGTKVTMYARWQSAEAYQAMRQNPGPQPFLEEALTIARFEPAMYEIVRTFALSEGERQYLLSAEQGQGLISDGTQRVAFHALASPMEYQLITTDPAELAALTEYHDESSYTLLDSATDEAQESTMRLRRTHPGRIPPSVAVPFIRKIARDALTAGQAGTCLRIPA